MQSLLRVHVLKKNWFGLLFEGLDVGASVCDVDCAECKGPLGPSLLCVKGRIILQMLGDLKQFGSRVASIDKSLLLKCRSRTSTLLSIICALASQVIRHSIGSLIKHRLLQVINTPSVDIECAHILTRIKQVTHSLNLWSLCQVLLV